MTGEHGKHLAQAQSRFIERHSHCRQSDFIHHALVWPFLLQCISPPPPQTHTAVASHTTTATLSVLFLKYESACHSMCRHTGLLTVMTAWLLLERSFALVPEDWRAFAALRSNSWASRMLLTHTCETVRVTATASGVELLLGVLGRATSKPPERWHHNVRKVPCEVVVVGFAQYGRNPITCKAQAPPPHTHTPAHIRYL